MQRHGMKLVHSQLNSTVCVWLQHVQEMKLQVAARRIRTAWPHLRLCNIARCALSTHHAYLALPCAPSQREQLKQEQPAEHECAPPAALAAGLMSRHMAASEAPASVQMRS
jgi:hypothetical protein